MMNEVNAGSMADMAFLPLIFFLVTTRIKTDRGLTFMLPPENDNPAEVHERNIFKILINAHNDLLVEGEPFTDLARLRQKLRNMSSIMEKTMPEA